MHFDVMHFYAPGSNDREHIVFVLSVCLLGLRSAPKISVLRGSEGPVRVSILEIQISVQFVLYIALSKQQWWRWENNLSFDARDRK